MASIAGSCLCGALTLTVARAPKSVTQCNCSTCRRYGTLWAYFKRSAVTFKAPRGQIREFSLRRGGLRFRHCATCGCMATWEKDRSADARMGVNMRLFDHAAMARVPIKVLDGDKTWRVVDSYTKPAIWISL
ncbi:MAG TPA: GFA family protein [Kofleriaceae bacterium]|jgi:hypothetical protein